MIWCHVEHRLVADNCNASCIGVCEENIALKPQAEVVALRPDRASAAPTKAQPDLIQALEGMLAEARAGAIIGMTGVIMDQPGNMRVLVLGAITHQWVVAALTLAKFEAILDWREKNAQPSHRPKQ